MKTLKKLFLTSILFALSGANFLGAMEQTDEQLDEKTPLIQHNDYIQPSKNGSSSSSSSVSTIFTEEDLIPFDDKSSDEKIIIEEIFTQVAQKTNKSKQTLLKNWGKSQSINFCNTNFENTTDLEKIFSILEPIWKEIKKLDLSFCKIVNLPGLLTKKNFPNLEVLNLQFNTPKDESLKQIATLPIRELDLSFCEINKLSNIFKGNKLPKINILKLQGNPVSLDEEEKVQIQGTFKTTRIIFN